MGHLSTAAGNSDVHAQLRSIRDSAGQGGAIHANSVELLVRDSGLIAGVWV